MYRCYEAQQYADCPQWLQLGIVPVTAGTLQAEPNYEVRPRILKDFYLVWMCAGRGSLQSRGRQFALRAGDVYALFPDIVHAYRTDPEDLLGMYWIGFRGVSAQELVARAGFTPDNPVQFCGDMPEVRRAFEKLANSGKQEQLSDYIDAVGALLQVFATLYAARGTQKLQSAAPSSHSPVAAVAQDFMNVHYPEPITVAQIATYAGVSRATLATLFHRELGQTPSQYLCYVRMKRAVSLLSQTKLPVHEVAHRVGYADALYFSKAFAKQYGVTPSRFRTLACSNAALSF